MIETKPKKERFIDYLYFVAMAGLALWFAYTKGWILADFQSVDAQKAAAMLRNETNLTVIDVRTPKEYTEGHVKGAVLIPLQEIKKRLSELAPYKHTALLVYCRSGNRSIAASRILRAHGFTPVNVKGGIAALARTGIPIEKGATP